MRLTEVKGYVSAGACTSQRLLVSTPREGWAHCPVGFSPGFLRRVSVPCVPITRTFGLRIVHFCPSSASVQNAPHTGSPSCRHPDRIPLQMGPPGKRTGWQLLGLGPLPDFLSTLGTEVPLGRRSPRLAASSPTTPRGKLWVLDRNPTRTRESCLVQRPSALQTGHTGFLILRTSGKEGQTSRARVCSLREAVQTGGELFIM